MGLEIFKNNKKVGVHTNKIDPDSYFYRWEACIPIASKDQPQLVGQPCYKHKTCGHLVASPHSRVPPKICDWCGVDTVKEAKMVWEYVQKGIALFDAPQEVVTLKEATFGRIARYLRSD